MGKVYMFSDPHFGHKNIIEYASRPFQSVEEMDRTIIDNWNKTVNKDDKVFILGDVSFYDKEITKNIITSLKGNKTLIKGNHDKSRASQFWIDVGFKEVSKYPIVYMDDWILSHRPMGELRGFKNAHGHIHDLIYMGGEVRGYFNVSVEQINYTPIDFKKILKIKI